MKPRNNDYDKQWGEDDIEAIEEPYRSITTIDDEDEALDRLREGREWEAELFERENDLSGW